MCLAHLHAVSDAYQQALFAGEIAPLSRLIHSTAAVSKSSRISVYQNNQSGTLKQVLAAAYPVCREIVGARYFQQLSAYHIKQHPSSDRNVDNYGDSFAATLERLIHIRAELDEMPYLADMARLEWLLHKAYYAADRISFDFTGFAKLSSEQQTQVQFRLAEDIELMNSSYAVCQLWQAHQNEQIQNDNNLPDFSYCSASPQYLLIQRKQWRCDVEIIDKPLFQLLMAIRQGKPLLEFAQYQENSSMDITGLIHSGMVSHIEPYD